MKKIKLQHGFSPIIAVLIIVALGIIGFVAWRVYDSTTQANNSLNNAATSRVDPIKESKEDAKTKKIVIPYIDFELEVPDSIKDLTFYESTFEDQARVQISSKSLESLDTNCKPSLGSPLGALIKTPGKFADLSEERIPGVLVKQFDGYSISYRSSQAACSENSEAQTLQTSSLRTLSEALNIKIN